MNDENSNVNLTASRAFGCRVGNHPIAKYSPGGYRFRDMKESGIKAGRHS